MLYKKISDEGVKLSAIDVLRSGGSAWQKTEEQRADMTLLLRDTDYLPKVSDAGKVKTVNGERVQIMHNGLKVLRGGYQGEWQARVIEGLKGNHEPQEEKVFFEVLKRIKKPAGHMIELGAWWAYYSMWYAKETGGTAIACEPDPNNVELGRKNARLNDLTEGKNIVFHNVAAGREDGLIEGFYTESDETIDIPVLSVDSVVDKENISQLDILHMDIQGYELDALHSAQKTIRGKKLRFLFVSTHHYEISSSPSMHQACVDFIKSHGGHIVASHTVYESCSGDGLIVASFADEDKDFTVDITLEHTDDSLFRSPEIDTQILWDTHGRLLEMLQISDGKAMEYQGEVNTLKAQLEETSQQIAHLEGRLMEVMGLKSHLRRALIDRAKGIDMKIQHRLNGEASRLKPSEVLFSDEMSIEQLLDAAKTSDVQNERRFAFNEPTMAYKTYRQASRTLARGARKMARKAKRK